MAGEQTDVFEVSISSSYEMMERVVALVEEAAARIGVSEDEVVDLMISVTEAVTNAIQHGNREDEGKQVHVRIETAPSQISVWVKDEGGGFDMAAVPDPRDSDNLLKESGRGILMMKAFMDEVQFSMGQKGTEVRMVKGFGGENDPGP